MARRIRQLLRDVRSELGIKRKGFADLPWLLPDSAAPKRIDNFMMNATRLSHDGARDLLLMCLSAIEAVRLCGKRRELHPRLRALNSRRHSLRMSTLKGQKPPEPAAILVPPGEGKKVLRAIRTRLEEMSDPRIRPGTLTEIMFEIGDYLAGFECIGNTEAGLDLLKTIEPEYDFLRSVPKEQWRASIISSDPPAFDVRPVKDWARKHCGRLAEFTG